MTKQVKGSSGYTLIEILTGIGIVGIVLATALPHLDPRRTDIETTMQMLMGDLRVTRAKAISSGVHFSFSRGTAGRYQLRRHREGADDDWPVDEVVKTVDLPETVQFWVWPNELEFNTRGMLVDPQYPALLFVVDYAAASTWHAVAVWPSGQVYQEW